jgi:hypothetical protein
MTKFFDALANAELFLLGVSVEAVKSAQTRVGDEVARQPAENSQTEWEFHDEHYRTALG